MCVCVQEQICDALDDDYYVFDCPGLHPQKPSAGLESLTDLNDTWKSRQIELYSHLSVMREVVDMLQNEAGGIPVGQPSVWATAVRGL